MEVYAGFLEHCDHEFGRILDTLEKIGELDNTLIMVMPDNGASSEGGVNGAFNEMSSFNYYWETLEDILPRMDELGGPASYNHYPWGWSWAGNAPFRRWKKEVYRGGCTDNLIVHWPNGVKAKGENRAQYAHAIDMVPTVLEVLGIEPPESIRGVAQSPIEGVSFAHTFEDAEAPSKHQTQYFEMFANRAIDHDGWRAVCGFPGPSYAEGAKKGRHLGDEITPEVLDDLDANGWELYHIAEDPAEARVRQRHRQRDRAIVGNGQAAGQLMNVSREFGPRAAFDMTSEQLHQTEAGNHQGQADGHDRHNEETQAQRAAAHFCPLGGPVSAFSMI